MSQATITAGEVAALCQGRVVGDESALLRGVAPLSSAGPGDLTFFAPTAKGQHAELLRALQQSTASAVVLREPLDGVQATQIVAEHPYIVVVELAARLFPRPVPELGVHPSAVLDASAKLGLHVRIGAYAVIGKNCVLGERSRVP